MKGHNEKKKYFKGTSSNRRGMLKFLGRNVLIMQKITVLKGILKALLICTDS